MKLPVARVVVACFFLVLSLSAQTSGRSAASAQVPPPLIQFSNVATDAGGNSLSGELSITFSLYSSQQGGEPLWTETQNNIQLDATGHYSVQLGITQPNGVPTTLFNTGEARWLGVRIADQTEQPRLLLLSVPYALKAGDSATLGGLPASAYMLAPTTDGNGSALSYVPETAGASAPPSNSAVTGAGTVNYLPLWDTTSDIVSSVLFQSGTGATAKVGIGTATPATTLDVKGGATIRGVLTLPSSGGATATKGGNSQPMTMAASAFNSGTSTAVNQVFEWQAEPAGNDTTSPSATLNFLFAQGAAKPAETGLQIASNGQITFATGQTFPGTGSGDGSVTSVGSGSGLTGGPITTSGTLSIATGGVENAMLAHPSLTVTAGTDLTGGGAVALGGSTTLNLDTTKVPQLATNNTFAGSQILNGSLGVRGAGTFTGGVTINNTIGGTGVSGTSTACTNLTGCPGGLFTGNTSLADPQNAGDGIDSFGGATYDLNGGNGIVANGGSGTNEAALGGIGVIGNGGAGGDFGGDGSGGAFTGGNSSLYGDGVDAFAGSGIAGYFVGNIDVTGQIFSSAKDIRIDHPLDPANKYLVHSSVESSEMMNIYTGNITTDSQGNATVQLPEWFESLNTDFRYQLTVIGQFAQAIVSQEIENHRFVVKTSAPNVKVSWQVTGIRQDAYAKAHTLVVEQEKEVRMRGFYIHPELYGAPPEKQIAWARHPQTMKRIQAMNARQLAPSQK